MELIYKCQSTDCVLHYDVKTNSKTLLDLLPELIDFRDNYGKGLQKIDLYFIEYGYHYSKVYNLDYEFNSSQLSCKIDKVELNDGYGRIYVMIYVDSE